MRVFVAARSRILGGVDTMHPPLVSRHPKTIYTPTHTRHTLVTKDTLLPYTRHTLATHSLP